jgi:GntR family transcriptional regulator, transcriptional repressor for pyruvate dehydrogenase complex
MSPTAAKKSKIPASGKAQWIAEAIRADIASGKLKPGDILPTESILMAAYDVSPPTMRAALRILQSDGLVRIQRGARGGPRIQELDVDVLAKQAGLYLQVGGADLADLLEALVVMQPDAVGLAAERRTKQQLRELRRCVTRAKASGTMSDFSEVAADFVVLLLEASGNKSIKLFALVTRSLIHHELHRHLDYLEPNESIQWNAMRFGELVDLIEAGEAAAAAALWRAHMLTTITPDLKRPARRRSTNRPTAKPIPSAT